MFVIVSIYVMILRHMRVNSFFITDRQRRMERRRQRREVRLYFRIVVLNAVLFIMGIPYCVFFAISMINGASPSPPYAIGVGYGVSMMLSLLYTDDVRHVVSPFDKRERREVRRRRRIQCITTLTLHPSRRTIVEVTA
jgi:ABC-type Fe3+ transport system permease subunit